jgi:hypothetical protein
MRACEEGWVGTSGYRRADGTHQKYAIAFQSYSRLLVRVSKDGAQCASCRS